VLERISKKIGITKTEIKLLLFIVFVFAGGFIYKQFFYSGSQTPLTVFDYTDEDEKFFNSNRDSLVTDSINIDKISVDYKDEVLDFKQQNFNKFQKKILPADKSINLNTANLNELITLPGIGDKTAKSILEYREKVKRFKNVSELLKVKGIGENKLNKIKKYIYID
jgi:comEA protein